MPPLPLLIAATIDCITLLVILSPVIWMIINLERKHQLEQKRAEELLLEQSARFYNLANSGQALIWTSDRDRKFQYFNQPWLDFTGRKLDEETGEGWLEGIHPDDLNSFKELYNRSFEQRKPFNAEYRLRNLNGKFHWIQNAGTPWYNSKNEFIGYIGHCLDITSSKESAAYREMAREILLVMNENAPLHKLTDKVATILQRGTNFDSINIRLSGDDWFTDKQLNPPLNTGKNGQPNIEKNTKFDNLCFCRIILSGKNKFPDPGFTQGGSWWTNNLSTFEHLPGCTQEKINKQDPFFQEGFESVALIPVRNKENIFGLIQIGSQQKDKLSKLIVERLENIALHFGSAILHKMDEYALKEKDEMLAQTQKIAHLGSWSLDLLTNQLSWSDQVYRIFGIQPDEFAGTYEAFIEYIHPEDREMVDNLYNKSIRDGKNGYEIEHRIIQKNTNKIRYVFEKCNHIRDDSGKIVKSVGMVHDITERKKFEIALTEKERLLRESQEVAHIGSYSFDLNKNIWKATNEVYKIFGIPKDYPHTLEGWINCLHPDYKESLLNELLNNRKKIIEFNHEYKIIRVNDHKERWLQGHGKLEFDSSKNPARMIGTIQDITSRKQVEEEIQKLNKDLEERVRERTAELVELNNALKDAEQKYRTIANHTFDWEFWINPDGKFIYVSPSCKRITGYSAQEFKNNDRLFIEIVHPEDREMVDHHFYVEHGDKNTGSLFDFRIITKEGEVKWIAHSCNAVYDQDGNWIGQRGSNRDITTRKVMEENLLDSQKKLRALTQHINNLMEEEKKQIAREIHDELGHMLTVIKYDLTNLTNNRELAVEQVHEELHVMVGLVDSLIDAVRKIATELRPGVLDHLGLFPAIEWQINQFQMMTKIQCDCELDELEIEFNKQETTTIFRILQEILTNIARHSNAKKVVIKIFSAEEDFYLTVKDDGVGFNLEEKLQSGSLGLIGMQERALSIKGEVSVESYPGKGTLIS
ncbi:MAG: PAS domain-containing protein [Prolixibacteraceae bacterium]|nr:PAS domain-containing protein [Prolixibacteraceae bacterium]